MRPEDVYIFSVDANIPVPPGILFRYTENAITNCFANLIIFKPSDYPTEEGENLRRDIEAKNPLYEARTLNEVDGPLTYPEDKNLDIGFVLLNDPTTLTGCLQAELLIGDGEIIDLPLPDSFYVVGRRNGDVFHAHYAIYNRHDENNTIESVNLAPIPSVLVG